MADSELQRQLELALHSLTATEASEEQLSRKVADMEARYEKLWKNKAQVDQRLSQRVDREATMREEHLREVDDVKQRSARKMKAGVAVLRHQLAEQGRDLSQATQELAETRQRAAQAGEASPGVGVSASPAPNQGSSPDLTSTRLNFDHTNTSGGGSDSDNGRTQGEMGRFVTQQCGAGQLGLALVSCEQRRLLLRMGLRVWRSASAASGASEGLAAAEAAAAAAALMAAEALAASAASAALLEAKEEAEDESGTAELLKTITRLERQLEGRAYAAEQLTKQLIKQENVCADLRETHERCEDERTMLQETIEMLAESHDGGDGGGDGRSGNLPRGAPPSLDSDRYGRVNSRDVPYDGGYPPSHMDSSIMSMSDDTHDDDTWGRQNGRDERSGRGGRGEGSRDSVGAGVSGPDIHGNAPGGPGGEAKHGQEMKGAAREEVAAMETPRDKGQRAFGRRLGSTGRASYMSTGVRRHFDEQNSGQGGGQGVRLVDAFSASPSDASMEAASSSPGGGSSNEWWSDPGIEPALRTVFGLYSNGTGRAKMTGGGMTMKPARFARMARGSGMLDETLSPADVDIVFRHVMNQRMLRDNRKRDAEHLSRSAAIIAGERVRGVPGSALASEPAEHNARHRPSSMMEFSDFCDALVELGHRKYRRGGGQSGESGDVARDNMDHKPAVRLVRQHILSLAERSGQRGGASTTPHGGGNVKSVGAGGGDNDGAAREGQPSDTTTDGRTGGSDGFRPESISERAVMKTPAASRTGGGRVKSASRTRTREPAAPAPDLVSNGELLRRHGADEQLLDVLEEETEAMEWWASTTRVSSSSVDNISRALDALSSGVRLPLPSPAGSRPVSPTGFSSVGTGGNTGGGGTMSNTMRGEPLDFDRMPSPDGQNFQHEDGGGGGDGDGSDGDVGAALASLLAKYEGSLRELFLEYTVRDFGRGGRRGRDALGGNSQRLMDSSGFMKLASSHGIVPALLSRRQALECFTKSADEVDTGRSGGSQPGGVMEFGSFLMCCCEIAQLRYGDRENDDGWSDADKVRMLLYRMDTGGKIFKGLTPVRVRRTVGPGGSSNMGPPTRGEGGEGGGGAGQENINSERVSSRPMLPGFHMNDVSHRWEPDSASRGARRHGEEGAVDAVGAERRPPSHAGMQEEWGSLLKSVFHCFCSLGNSGNKSTTMDRAQFTAFVRSLQLLGGRHQASQEEYIYTHSLSKAGVARMGYGEFCEAIKELARQVYGSTRRDAFAHLCQMHIVPCAQKVVTQRGGGTAGAAGAAGGGGGGGATDGADPRRQASLGQQPQPPHPAANGEQQVDLREQNEHLRKKAMSSREREKNLFETLSTREREIERLSDLLKSQST